MSLSSHNPLHSSNGQSGIYFNIINTAATALTVTGFSQGSYSYSGVNNMTVQYMPAPYVVSTTGYTQVANAVPATIPAGGTFASPTYSGQYAITPVVIPVGATYGYTGLTQLGEMFSNIAAKKTSTESDQGGK